MQGAGCQLRDSSQSKGVTVDRWRKEGMPCIKVGRGVRFDDDVVMAWIACNKQE